MNFNWFFFSLLIAMVALGGWVFWMIKDIERCQSCESSHEPADCGVPSCPYCHPVGHPHQ